MNYQQLKQIIPNYSETASIRLPAILIKRMFNVVESALTSPCRHTSDYSSKGCDLCNALEKIQTLENESAE